MVFGWFWWSHFAGAASARRGRTGGSLVSRCSSLSPGIAVAPLRLIPPITDLRAQAESVEEPTVRVLGRVGRGQQFLPVEDRIGPGEEAQRLELVAHRLAAGGEPH